VAAVPFITVLVAPAVSFQTLLDDPIQLRVGTAAHQVAS